MTRLSKPVVIFLDNETQVKRMQIMDLIRPNTNGFSQSYIITQPRLVITNLSRHGKRLDSFIVRGSRCNPHFINRDCYKNAIVYGDSDWIGDNNEYIFTVPPHQYDSLGYVLPTSADWLPFEWSYPEGRKAVEKDTDNIVLGDIECQ